MCLFKQTEGGVIISGYDNEIYTELLPGWRKVVKKALADGAKQRTECLWLNPAVQTAATERFIFNQ